MSPNPKAACAKCGAEHELGQGFSLPESGGTLSVLGGEVTEFVCGRCWAARPSDDWPCPGCSRANPDGMNWCLTCGTYRSDPRPYVPDWDLIAKEEGERKREAEALAAEWDRECPGWRFPRR